MLLVYGKSILSVKADFDQRIRFRVHDEKRVRFWHDVRSGQFVMLSLFPNPYLKDRR